MVGRGVALDTTVSTSSRKPNRTSKYRPFSLPASLAAAESRKELTMNRLLWIASVAFLLAGTTGCLRHNTRGGCNTGNCGTCSSGNCGKSSGGLLGKLANKGGCAKCGHEPWRTSCQPGPIGWQQGGHNYGAHLQPGGLAAHLAPGHAAAQQLQSQPFNPGPPTGTVAYPYYTHRGPRDFLLDNPPTIGR
jgi:hypothetical protein